MTIIKAICECGNGYIYSTHRPETGGQCFICRNPRWKINEKKYIKKSEKIKKEILPKPKKIPKTFRVPSEILIQFKNGNYESLIEFCKKIL